MSENPLTTARPKRSRRRLYLLLALAAVVIPGVLAYIASS